VAGAVRRQQDWRGAVVTIATTTLAALVLAHLSGCCWPLPVLVPFAEEHPLVWGLLLGTGYIVGRTAQQLRKRQLDIAPARRARARGRVFWVIDQLDSLFRDVAVRRTVWQPSLGLLAWIVAIMLVAHP